MAIWYPIPGFKLYVITKTGKVKNISTGKIHKGNLCGSGYWNHHLITDMGTQLVIGLHRLLALTFIPNEDPERNHVNHIDGNKLNNAISNLEWCTLLENMIHAGKIGISPKCLSITVRNPITKEVKFFNSIKEAGNFVGVSRDSMRYRYWKFNGKVYPEGFQYHKGMYEGVWIDPIDIEKEKLEIANYIISAKPVLILNLKTGKIKVYNTLTEACKIIGIRRQTLSAKLRAIDCPVFPPHYQVKFDDGTDWRKPETLAKEFKKSLGIMAIIVEHVETGEKRRFNTMKELMKELNMTRATLLGRLRYFKKKTVDGYYYYHEI